MGEVTRFTHASLSWTVYYDNVCPIYKFNKDISGWYPKKKPKGRRTVTVLYRKDEDDNEEESTDSLGILEAEE
jgi:hypothetical protein